MAEAQATGTASPPEQIGDFLGSGKLEDGIALCLSGGGYRAMLFHLGVFFRLNDGGLLPLIDRVATVSGGSIAGATLAVAWDCLDFNDKGVASNLSNEVAVPILALADRTVDVPAILLGLAPFVSAAKIASRTYDKALFRGKTLQDLPIKPRFVFTATSLQTGALWRFARPYAAEWRVGEWKEPLLPLAEAVAASAAFPPYLSPMRIRPPRGAIQTLPGTDLSASEFGGELVLTDGGVYDNLGLEPVWKRYRTILVSDGGGIVSPNAKPWTNWLGQATRATSIALQQGIDMRERVLRGLAASGQRRVAYWSIARPVSGSRITASLGAEALLRAARVPTRLKRLPLEVQNLLMKAGYAHADSALRDCQIGQEPSHDDFGSLPLRASSVTARPSTK